MCPLEIHKMRQRGEWEGPDSVYNTWLLSNNSRRKWFPYKFFPEIYPDWEEKKNQIFEEENGMEFSLENHPSLLSSVDKDDKNNCRPSSSKSENKHIMLDTSEQDLDSSYCNTQDSDTEDDSNTNGSASEQNLYISRGESDSENSDIAIARPEKKKKKIKDKKAIVNIKLEHLLPSFRIKETIFISDNKSQDESKSNIKKFVPVKQAEDIIILGDSD